MICFSDTFGVASNYAADLVDQAKEKYDEATAQGQEAAAKAKKNVKKSVDL